MILSSCGEKDAFTITGTLDSNTHNGQKVYLQEIGENWREYVNVDSAIIEKGTFEFRGVARTEPTLRFVSFPDSLDKNKTSVSGIVIVEPGSIAVTIDNDGQSVKGTPANDNYQVFASKMNSFDDELKNIYHKIQDNKSNEPLIAELESQYESKSKEQQDALTAFLRENIQTQVGTYIFANSQYSLTLDELKELTPKVNAELKNHDRIKNIEKRVQALEATEEGKQFVDIKGNAPDGKEVALSDYAGKGNYVLIDFWASWCPPCRKDMPNLVDVYNKYKSKGFVIVGVSLDDDKAAWEKGIKDLNITWPQVSDLKGWKSELSGAYGVASIPHTVLLDKEGKIIAKGLHGKEVMAKLDELLK